VNGGSQDPFAAAVAKVVESTFRDRSLWRWAVSQTRWSQHPRVCDTDLHVKTPVFTRLGNSTRLDVQIHVLPRNGRYKTLPPKVVTLQVIPILSVSQNKWACVYAV
jgi:hypothetical protein